jgi:hypothetical protein
MYEKRSMMTPSAAVACGCAAEVPLNPATPAVGLVAMLLTLLENVPTDGAATHDHLA